MSRKTRKLMWSVPLIAAVAVIGALAIFMAQTPNLALAHDIPGAVGDLKAEAQEDGSIKLTWVAPSTGGTPTGYRIDYLPKATGSIWKLLEADAGSATTYTDSALGSETGRDYRVFAFNEHGTGPVSKVAGAAIPDAGAPGKVPTFDTPRAAGYSQLNLSWTAPEKDGGSPITSYRIVMAAGTETLPPNADTVTPNPSVTLAAGTPTTIDTGSDATTYSVMGLRAQQAWRISIYARNKAGMNSPNSISTTAAPIIRTQITGPAGKPTAPTNLVATFDATNGVDLYWLGPTDDGGADIVKYRIEVRKSGKNWPKATTAVSTDLNADIDGTNGFGVAEVQKTVLTTAYDYRHNISAEPDLSDETLQYRVIAVTGTGQDEMVGPASAGVGIRAATNSNQPGAPTANTTAFADGQTPTSIDLNWVAPTDNPGSGYRIDYKKGATGSTDPWMPLVTNTNFTNLQYTHGNLTPAVAEADRSYVYRIFNIKAGVTGPAFRDTGISATITAPGAPTGLTATAVDGEQVNLMWKAPKENGGVPVTEYFVHVASAASSLSATGDIAAMPAPCATDVNAVLRTKSADLKYSVKGLCAQKTYNFAVTAYNGDSFTGATPTAGRRGVLSNTVAAVTDAIGSIEAPNGFVAETAQDSNLTDGSKRGVLLIWNAPADPTGGKLVTYEIERKVDDGDFIDLADGMLSGADGAADAPYTGPITYHTDESEPKADEKRMYRIRAKGQVLSATNTPVTTETVTSTWVEVSYDLGGTPMHLHLPGAPTGVSAMADGRTTINVSWRAPATGATGYIAERAYMGSFLDDGVAHPDFAFSDHMQWWETLNCEGMLLAVGSDADHTMDSDDKAMYCKHYANAGPTAEMTFPADKIIAVGSDVDMAIERYFNKRYVVTSATQISDTGLMPSTTHMYRVKAANAVGTGMWSDEVSATTTANQMPMAGDAIGDQTATEGDDPIMVQSTITDGDDAMLTWTASSDHEDVAAASVDDMGMVTITIGHAGTAKITVKATDMFDAYDEQTFMVTVESAEVPMPTMPTNVMASNVGTQVSVTWEDGEHADLHFIVLISRNADGSWNMDSLVTDQTPSGSPHPVPMRDRPAGTYLIGVAAGQDDGDWSDWGTGSFEYTP